jgi:hypothetical protein
MTVKPLEYLIANRIPARVVLLILASAVVAEAPLGAQPRFPTSGTGEGIACYGADTKSGWSVKQTSYYENTAGDRTTSSRASARTTTAASPLGHEAPRKPL